MEDKLVRYHRSHLRYYFKRVSAYFSIFLGVCVLVAIPVSIAAALRGNAEVKENISQKENVEEQEELQTM